MKNICIFCGSRLGNKNIYKTVAEELASELVRNSMGLVYGGGKIGMMGTIADKAIMEGGKVIGVIPHFLMQMEVAHNNLTELHVVDSMHERKAMMYKISDAFVALPGGFGTLDEFCEIITWSQLEVHQKPMAILNVNSFFDQLVGQFQHAVNEGFVHEGYMKNIIITNSVSELLPLLKSYERKSISINKWNEEEK